MIFPECPVDTAGLPVQIQEVLELWPVLPISKCLYVLQFFVLDYQPNKSWELTV